ncbi:MAG: YceH family protein [Terriglobales bacterium]
MDLLLNDVEVRVLGALAEKEITTPDYYPLSLNALLNACNQKSSRDPVMELGEDEVRDALSSLGGKRLAGPVSSADSRVTKYEHRLQEVFNFDRRESAVLCVLLLRGPQTPGELRGRTERMYRFEELSDVQSTLQRLMQREPPLVTVLRRQPGTKEARYAHLFSGEVEGAAENQAAVQPDSSQAARPPRPLDADRIARLETELAELREKVAALEQHIADLEASR